MRAGIVINGKSSRLEAIHCAAEVRAVRQHRPHHPDGCSAFEGMGRSGKPKLVVARWQGGSKAEDVEGLLRDKTRKPRKPPREGGGATSRKRLTTNRIRRCLHQPSVWTFLPLHANLGLLAQCRRERLPPNSPGRRLAPSR